MDSFFCECTEGFTGETCETNIDDCNGVICPNNQTCHDGINNYTCLCPGGFTESPCKLKLMPNYNINVNCYIINHLKIHYITGDLSEIYVTSRCYTVTISLLYSLGSHVLYLSFDTLDLLVFMEGDTQVNLCPTIPGQVRVCSSVSNVSKYCSTVMSTNFA